MVVCCASEAQGHTFDSKVCYCWCSSIWSASLQTDFNQITISLYIFNSICNTRRPRGSLASQSLLFLFDCLSIDRMLAEAPCSCSPDFPRNKIIQYWLTPSFSWYSVISFCLLHCYRCLAFFKTRTYNRIWTSISINIPTFSTSTSTSWSSSDLGHAPSSHAFSVQLGVSWLETYAP